MSEAKKEAVRKPCRRCRANCGAKYTKEFGPSSCDAAFLTDDKGTALYYEDVTAHLASNASAKPYKQAANWVMGDVRSWVNEKGLSNTELPISAERLAGLGQLGRGREDQPLAGLAEGFRGCWRSPALQKSWPRQTAFCSPMPVPSEEAVRGAMARFPGSAWRPSALINKGLLGLFMGEVMKRHQREGRPAHRERDRKTHA
ncbi:MAG: hypothetical protein IPL81_14550 [Flavobacteriales bacterium]|nr:hypothetical protein [Flavobacteriales bacterium]